MEELPKSKSKLSDFDMDKKVKLGSGSFGVVYKVRRVVDNNVYVLKQINIANLKKITRNEAINEVTILNKLEHPNIVKYYDSFIENKNLNIIMEFCEGGDLSVFIRKVRMQNQLVQENKIWKLFIQAFSNSRCALGSSTSTSRRSCTGTSNP